MPSLDKELAPFMRSSALRDVDVAVQVVHVDSGDELFSVDADEPLAPASTMKLVTTATALRELGPTWRFKTKIKVVGDIQDGVLDGSVYVRGEADPTLVIEKLWKLAYDLKLQGVEEITGNVVFDASYLDLDYTLPGWDKAVDMEDGPTYFPPIGALSLNYNTVAVLVGPGAAAGKAARVQLETPARDVIRLKNDVSTGDEGSRRSLDIERALASDHVSLVVSGSVPAKSSTDRYYRTVGDPLAYFMGAMSVVFEQVGIKVRGEFVRGAVPEDARTLVELTSPPLSTVLFDINKYSNNFMAEIVLRTLGAQKRGVGTNAAGVEVVRGYLTAIGVPAAGVVIKNGSGLSRDTRLAPEHLTAVLVDMARDPKVSPEFVASLSIAGRDGTLRRRMTDTEGAVRGKTGTLSGVHCLAGYVETRDREQLAFVFLANEVRGSVTRVKDLQDGFVERLSELDLGALER